VTDAGVSAEPEVAVTSRVADARRWRRALIAFGVVLALFQVFRAVHGARTSFITNDGDYYYAYLASLYFDRDLDLSDELARSQLIAGRPALHLPSGRPTPTSFTVGPALLWMPAFALADAGVLAAQTFGLSVARTGYSMPYQLAVALATLLYGLLGVWCAFQAALWWCGADALRSRNGAAIAVAAALCASPTLYYLVFEPTMAHGLSVFAASLLVWLWLKTGLSGKWARWLAVGLAGGLCALIRPQDGLLLLLPISSVLGLRYRRALPCASALVLGAAIAFLPQMLTWQATFGRPFAVPQGPEFLQWTRPALLQVWFSIHHGLFTWTPIWVLALIGLALAPSHMRRLVVAMVAVFLLESYVNAAARDWWAGDAFGARRFLGLFPIFAVGLSALACRGRERWEGAFTGVATLLTAANLALMAAYVTGRVAHG
jgi:hypothetical protein